MEDRELLEAARAQIAELEAEAERLLGNIQAAGKRLQEARPASRGAYRAHCTRARKSLQEFDGQLARMGLKMVGGIGNVRVIAMTPEEKQAYQFYIGIREKGEAPKTDDQILAKLLHEDDFPWHLPERMDPVWMEERVNAIIADVERFEGQFPDWEAAAMLQADLHRMFFVALALDRVRQPAECAKVLLRLEPVITRNA